MPHTSGSCACVLNWVQQSNNTVSASRDEQHCVSHNKQRHGNGYCLATDLIVRWQTVAHGIQKVIVALSEVDSLVEARNFQRAAAPPTKRVIAQNERECETTTMVLSKTCLSQMHKNNVLIKRRFVQWVSPALNQNLQAFDLHAKTYIQTPTTSPGREIGRETAGRPPHTPKKRNARDRQFTIMHDIYKRTSPIRTHRIMLWSLGFAP